MNMAKYLQAQEKLARLLPQLDPRRVQFYEIDEAELLRATLRVEIAEGAEVFEEWDGERFASPLAAPTPIADGSSNSTSTPCTVLSISDASLAHPSRDGEAEDDHTVIG